MRQYQAWLVVDVLANELKVVDCYPAKAVKLGSRELQTSLQAQGLRFLTQGDAVQSQLGHLHPSLARSTVLSLKAGDDGGLGQRACW